MTKGLRWRIFVLQIGLIGIFAFAAGMLIYGGNFSRDTIRGELTAQQITFPGANSTAVTGLPAADAAAMAVYSNQLLTTGDQAQVYADHFINVHIDEVGMTYSQASAKSMANPTDTKLAGTVATLFKGETLRSMLLNAYGWWTVGTIAFWGGVGMAVASLAVLVASLVEIYLARKATTTDKVKVRSVQHHPVTT